MAEGTGTITKTVRRGAAPELPIPVALFSGAGAEAAISAPLPSAPVTGQLALTAASRGQLGNNALVNGLVVKASSGNAASVLVGGSTVTSTEDGSGNGYPLTPGEAISFAVTNSNAIYLISTAAAVVSFAGN